MGSERSVAARRCWISTVLQWSRAVQLSAQSLAKAPLPVRAPVNGADGAARSEGDGGCRDGGASRRQRRNRVC